MRSRLAGRSSWASGRCFAWSPTRRTTLRNTSSSKTTVLMFFLQPKQKREQTPMARPRSQAGRRCCPASWGGYAMPLNARPVPACRLLMMAFVVACASTTKVAVTNAKLATSTRNTELRAGRGQRLRTLSRRRPWRAAGYRTNRRAPPRTRNAHAARAWAGGTSAPSTLPPPPATAALHPGNV